jgi:hypothetical protein
MHRRGTRTLWLPRIAELHRRAALPFTAYPLAVPPPRVSPGDGQAQRTVSRGLDLGVSHAGDSMDVGSLPTSEKSLVPLGDVGSCYGPGSWVAVMLRWLLGARPDRLQGVPVRAPGDGSDCSRDRREGARL